ncbi:MAG: hypothetical protein TH68_02375, partial [Candidatus Synechococcus spongiarum 142]
ADTASLVVSPEAVTVAEAGSATYTVKLATPPVAAVAVTISGMGSDVSVDTDPRMGGGQTTLSFSASNWETEQTVTVRAAADDNAGSEEVRLSHTAAGGGYGSVSQELVVTVTDDDTASLVFSPEAVTVAEAGSATYTVQLATPPTETVIVAVKEMVSSSINVDPARLRFTTSDWNTAQTVTLSAAADARASVETVTLRHTGAGGEYGTLIQGLIVTMTEMVTVTTVTEEEEQDNICERYDALNADETVCNLYSKGISSLSSNDFAGLPDLKTLSLKRNELSSLPENIFAGLPNLETLYLDENYIGKLSEDVFADLSKLKTIWLGFNPLVNSLPENIFAGLSNLQEIRLQNASLSSLPEDVFADLSKLNTIWLTGNSSFTCLPRIPQSVSTLDLNRPPCSLVLSASAVTMIEGDSSSYTVKLSSQPKTGDVTVTVVATDNGVTVDTDSSTNGDQTTLIFSSGNWETEQTVTVVADQDDNTRSKVVTLTHTTATGSRYPNTSSRHGQIIVATVSESVQVTVIDDDTPTLLLSTEAVRVEEGGSATYTMKLITAPTEAVIVTVSGMGSGVSVDTDSGMAGEQTTLHFGSNWDTEQTVTVSAAPDDNAIFETVTLSHTAGGGDYDGVTAQLEVSVTDTDTAGLVFSPVPVPVVEAGSTIYT